MKCIGKVLIVLACVGGTSWQIEAEKMNAADQNISIGRVAADKRTPKKMDRNALEMVIVSQHNYAFGKDRLYKDKPDQKGLDGWNSVLKNVKKFVEEKTTDKVLTNAISELLKTNDKLVKALKLTYSSLFAPGITGSMNVLRPIANDQKNEFLKIEQKVKTITRNLDKESYIMSAKKEVKGLLLYLCPFIEHTAKKARTDIEKELKARGK